MIPWFNDTNQGRWDADKRRWDSNTLAKTHMHLFTNVANSANRSFTDNKNGLINEAPGTSSKERRIAC